MKFMLGVSRGEYEGSYKTFILRKGNIYTKLFDHKKRNYTLNLVSVKFFASFNR